MKPKGGGSFRAAGRSPDRDGRSAGRAGRRRPSPCRRRRGYRGSAAPRSPCRPGADARQHLLRSEGDRRAAAVEGRRPSLPRAPRHRRWRRPARRCRGPPPRSCRPCRRRRSRRRPADIRDICRSRAYLPPAFGRPVRAMSGRATMPEREGRARGSYRLQQEEISAPWYGDSQPVSRASNSFDAANGCMRILQPLESFLFSRGRPLRAAAAVIRHSRGRDVDGSAGIPADISSVYPPERAAAGRGARRPGPACCSPSASRR